MGQMNVKMHIFKIQNENMFLRDKLTKVNRRFLHILGYNAHNSGEFRSSAFKHLFLPL
jgi:hypothetical protein